MSSGTPVRSSAFTRIHQGRVLKPLRLKPADEFIVNEELRTCRVESLFEIEGEGRDRLEWGTRPAGACSDLFYFRVAP